MSEMVQALKMLGKLPANCLIEHTTGRWGFVGSVDVRLAYVAKDGSPATDEMIENARSFGPRLAGVKSRSWTTKEEAIAAAVALGIEIDEKKGGKNG